MTIRFSLKSFIIFIIIFIVEIIIALFVRDKIIRPYMGDVLVVILMYYFVKAFIETKTEIIVLFVLTIAYLVEIGQYFNLVKILGLEENKIMRIIIGSSFSWLDMLCYTIGAAVCYLIDRKNKA